MKLLRVKEVQKPLVSGGSFARFSGYWEKWAVGDINRNSHYRQKVTRRRQKRKPSVGYKKAMEYK
jgi:hypothetical protein